MKKFVNIKWQKKMNFFGTSLSKMIFFIRLHFQNSIWIFFENIHPTFSKSGKSYSMNSIQIANISTLSDFIEGGNILMSEENIQKVVDPIEEDPSQPQELRGVHELRGLGLGSPNDQLESMKEEDRKKFAANLRKHCPKAEDIIKDFELE